MTNAQLIQFNKYACVARAFLKLCELRKAPITRDDFCNRYNQHFLEPTNHYGAISVSGLFLIGKDLAHWSTLDTSSDPEYVKSQIQNRTVGPVFLVSHKPTNHNRLVVDDDSVNLKWFIWETYTDGSERLGDIGDADLPLTLPHFLMFRQ